MLVSILSLHALGGIFEQIELLFCLLIGCVDTIYNFGCCTSYITYSELSTIVSKEHNLSTKLGYKGISAMKAYATATCRHYY